MKRSKTSIRSMAIVAIVIAFISQITLAIQTMKAAGMGFFEYAQLSDFGLFLAMWGYSPVWTLAGLVFFLGGAATFFFSMRR